MKKVLTFALILSVATVSAQVTRDKNGNYHEATPDSTTAFTFTDQSGNATPVYQTAKGKAYVAKVSKSGKYYRRYLTVEGEATETKSNTSAK